MSQDKPWLQSYPAGVPPEIGAPQHASLAAFLAQGFERHAENVAYASFGTPLTYAELGRLSACFAAYLQACLGLAKGTRVALMLPNLLSHPVCLFGVLRGGYVAVNCNPLYTARELHHQLADSGAEVVVVLENFAQTLSVALPGTAVRHVVVVALGDLLGPLKGALVTATARYLKALVPPWEIPGAVRFRQALALGEQTGFRELPLGLDDLAFLQYTGGTTGIAKAAMLSHGNILANIAQTRAWFGDALQAGTETVVTALPLYHVFALMANCFFFFNLGATNLLVLNPRDIPAFVRLLRRSRFTAITGVNTLFNALLAHPGLRRVDFSSLKVTLGGGMSVQRHVAEQWQAITGSTLVEAYGLTEASPAVTINPPALSDFNGCIGLPLPSTEIVIRSDDGLDVPLGESGEICVRGPQVMAAYWNLPEETAKVFWPDGFLRTGDIGVMDAQGFVQLIDRKKDMIIVSGFNVYPNEVEDVLALHPGVAEAAAIGVPDERCGESVKVFVVRREASVTAQALVAHCRANLASYKVPHHVAFVEALPKNAVGKILRRALKVGAV